VLVATLLLAVCAIPVIARLWPPSEVSKVTVALKSLPLNRLWTAAQAFSEAQKTNGSPVHQTLLLSNLVSGGYIQAEEVGILTNKHAAVFLDPGNANPSSVLVRVKLSTVTHDMELVADGSIHLIPPGK
jgi:hypothetical protein